MEENTLKAANNAGLANDLLAQATNETQVIAPAKITSPSDVLVNLPGGILIDGEVCKTAEVRELNGRDEEAIVRTAGTNRLFVTVLNRATTRIGNVDATEELLDKLLVGDRDALLLGIYRATFGDTSTVSSWCEGCREIKEVEIDVNSDIKYRPLVDFADATFTVKGKKKEFLVTLPTGLTQKKLLADPEANAAEVMTTLLEQCVLQIDGKPVFSKAQIQGLSIMDRREIAEAISDRNPGPLFEDLTIKCPDCEGEVQVPISLGTMFRF